MAEPPPMELQRSSRAPEVIRPRLQEWLRGHRPDAVISGMQGTSANGMSSDTLIFEATWTDESGPRVESLVARVAPDAADVPVFPAYDLTRQFDLIRAVGEQTEVPVPTMFWNEPSAEPVGAPFFVMSRVEGQVPPDVMPYNFGDNWLFDASPVQQRRLQDATVDVLVALHEMAPPHWLGFPDGAGDTPLRRHVAHTRAWYDFVAADGARSPLVEQAFEWVDANWPAVEGPPVVSWGDSRIGNVLYQDFAPAAVLDWEMAGIGPRELDVAWLVHAHRGFEDLATLLGVSGMPDFLRREDVVARYVAGSGVELHNLDFYETYAALQWGIVYLRTGARSVRFGEREMPDNPDELLYNAEPLRRMLAGTYF
ncbi:MAG: phosphotransferase family protein [Jatrophihabitans sp.]|uniref:phosphotransferase family protein n=1 Tax=Jatrophihabitans sp. TaxID=1932789 RepID=UPI0039160DE0